MLRFEGAPPLGGQNGHVSRQTEGRNFYYNEAHEASPNRASTGIRGSGFGVRAIRIEKVFYG